MQNSPSPDLKSVVELVARALAADHYGERFRKPVDDQHVAANVEANWTIYADQARVAVATLSTLLLTQKDRLDKLTWQPIETAKRDEEPRLLLMRDGQTVIGFWSNWNSYWTNGRSDRMSDHVMIGNPTHWMPLPEPPALTGSPT